jgi:hypothetical protein
MGVAPACLVCVFEPLGLGDPLTCAISCAPFRDQYFIPQSPDCRGRAIELSCPPFQSSPVWSLSRCGRAQIVSACTRGLRQNNGKAALQWPSYAVSLHRDLVLS